MRLAILLTLAVLGSHLTAAGQPQLSTPPIAPVDAWPIPPALNSQPGAAQGIHSARRPVLALTPGPTAHIAWEDRRSSPWSIGFRSVALNAGAVPSYAPGVEKADIGGAFGDAELPAIASSGEHLILTWRETNELHARVLVATSTASAPAAWTPPRNLTPGLPFEVTAPHVVMHASGETYVAWTQRNIVVEPATHRIVSELRGYFCHSSDFGVTWSAPRSIESTAPRHNRALRSLDIAMTPSGAALLAFVSNAAGFESDPPALLQFEGYVTRLVGGEPRATHKLNLSGPHATANRRLNDVDIAVGGTQRAIVGFQDVNEGASPTALIWAADSADDGATWSALRVANGASWSAGPQLEPWPLVAKPSVAINDAYGFVAYSAGTSATPSSRGALLLNRFALNQAPATARWDATDVLLDDVTVKTFQVRAPRLLVQGAEVLVCWRDGRFGSEAPPQHEPEYATVRLARSEDGGATWSVSPALEADSDPAVPAPTAAGSAHPQIAALDDLLVVTWDDRRLFTKPVPALTQNSTPAPTPAPWGAPVVLIRVIEL